MATEYLPDEKFPPEVIEYHRNIVAKDQIFREIVEKIPYPVLILNSLRQIVYYNNALVEGFSEIAMNVIFGKRPGDVFRCAHSTENEGCGTTKFCRTCGAAHAIAASLAGREDIEECRIVTFNDEAYDFRVWAYPKTIEGERFVIFTLIDISHEKRREIMERIFYHDILNTVNGIQGFLKIYFYETENKDEVVKSALNFTQILIDEINSQRIISLAEAGQLETSIERFSLSSLLDEIIELYKFQIEFKNIVTDLVVDENLELISDKILLRRIILNLLKNAIEASSENSLIRIKASKKDGYLEIKVFNQQVMPEEVKLQVFKRSFSTKGKGRGLGTYSIKMLTEKFLKGKVSFLSEKGYGTEFTILIPENIHYS